MNFRQMRYVIALSEELNFSHAAERLFISQPSLSQCIRAVESEVGAQLFVRAGGHVALTLAGEKFVEIARDILAQADRLAEEVVRAGQAASEQLTIGVSDSGSIMTPMLLPELQQRFPGVRFSFVEQPAGELELRILKGELDLIFTMLPTYQPEKLEVIPILRDDFLIACPRSMPAILACLADQDADHAGRSPFDHPQTGYPVLPLPFLMSLPFITVKRKRFEREMSRVMAEPDALHLNVMMEVANVITALSMVAAGNGVCPVPATIVRLGVQDPRVLYCRIGGLMPACELAVSYRKGTRLSPAAHTFISLLKELVHSHDLERSTLERPSP